MPPQTHPTPAPGRRMGIVLAALVLTAWTVPPARSDIARDEARGTWGLRSGPVEYRLRDSEGGPTLDAFGPWGVPGPAEAAPLYAPGPELVGSVQGRPFTAADFTRIEQQTDRSEGGVEELTLTLRHHDEPLEIRARYTIWGDTGTITRSLRVINRGPGPLQIDTLPSLSWRLPEGNYELSLLRSIWSRERVLVTEAVGPDGLSVGSQAGRSTNGHAAWFALRETGTGVLRVAQLAYSGNWELTLRRPGGGGLEVEMGMRFDSGGPLTLPPGGMIDLPAVAFTATGGDLDDAANQLHRYQRRFVMPPAPGDGLPKVQFNTWYPYSDKLRPIELMRTADVAAALGCEVFVLDAGWFVRENWEREIGDWKPAEHVFPAGLGAFAQYVRERGMGLGLWVEIENVGTESETFRDHPDWCLKADGQPIQVGVRRHLNFAIPEVRAHTAAALDRLIHEYQLDWIKFDYNIDVGDRFDPTEPGRSGDVLRQHLEAYGAWLDALRAPHPDLFIENCASGGLRFDLAMLKHAHTTWISDEVRPVPSLQLAYGATLEFPPTAGNHWMVGDTLEGQINPKDSPDWWDFQLRVAMNGQFGISSRVLEWPAEMFRRARQAVALYKRIRPVLVDADCYHLTPPPDPVEPTGWMALQYASPDRQRSVLMAYRLAQGEPERRFRLRGLDPDQTYRVRVEGGPAQTFTGRDLAGPGLLVRLDDEWRASVIELEAPTAPQPSPEAGPSPRTAAVRHLGNPALTSLHGEYDIPESF